MSVSSYLDLQIPDTSNRSTLSIIKTMTAAGWSITFNGETNYLPTGDADNFDWRSEAIHSAQFFDIISKKESLGELIGITMIWEGTEIGGDFLFHEDGLISISLSINRKRTPNKITDINWYIDKTVNLLRREGINVEHFTFSEHI